MNLARLGNKYLADTEPWKLIKTDADRVKTIIYISLQITANLSLVMEPFLPFTSVKLRAMINLNEPNWELCGLKEILKPGHVINKAELMFQLIEDEDIEAQLNKLNKSKKENEALANKDVSPAKENISFEEFSRMDIRTGTILEAEKVAKTKKLLKLTIDTGIDRRTVVSGIAEYYTPEEIIGCRVSILVNLAPRNLKGIESQGMILMAEDASGKLVFVSPDQKIANGSIVS